MALLAFVVPQGAAQSATKASGHGYAATSRSIDLLGEVYREVTETYVEEVDGSQLLFSGIDGMLEKLDPYSVFLDESESAELDELTTGQYAGIGITLGVVSGDLYVMSVSGGNAADRAGIHIGDRIVAVNGGVVRHKPLDEVRTAIKGPAGSAVRLEIERPGVRGRHEYLLTRSDVRVNTVGSASLIGTAGYVEVNSFGEHTSGELRAAVQSLQHQAAQSGGSLRGLILDLRGNPGGLLTSAVDVAGTFLGKGSTIVSIRGRTADSRQTFVTGTPPLFPSLPLVVLIDGDSASASEIVAGAIQEHDRGVIVGEPSFGKGLVQSIVPLSYDHVLKLTTSKYYTPSGRLIQKPLAHAEGSRSVVRAPGVTDSLKVFYTHLHRKVYGGGGITPDLVVRGPQPTGYERALETSGLFFRFANEYRSGHPQPKVRELNGQGLYRDFRRFLDREHFTFRSTAQATLDSLKVQVVKDYGSDGDGLTQRLADLDKALVLRSRHGLAGDSLRIVSALRREVFRHYDEQAARKMVVDEDPVVARALALLGDAAAYRALLNP